MKLATGCRTTRPARQPRAFRVIDNRTSELTFWDTDLLPDALSGLNDLDIFSFDDVLPLAATAGKTDPDDIPETPKNPVSRVGDIWTLGKHRLMCGDATKPEHVERLLDGAAARPDGDGPALRRELRRLMAVQGRGQHQGRAHSGSRHQRTTTGAIGTDAYALFPGSIAYAWMSSLALPAAARGLDACGFIRRSLIIWDKGRIVISRGHYHWRHETCWYAVKKGAQAHWNGDRKASTIWEIDKPRKSETGHSAQKTGRMHAAGHPQPPGRRLRSVRRVRYDDHRGRAREAQCCYAMEIEPAYVDVTVQRWEDFTGRKATKAKR